MNSNKTKTISSWCPIFTDKTPSHHSGQTSEGGVKADLKKKRPILRLPDPTTESVHCSAGWEAGALLHTRETFPYSSQQRHHTWKLKISLKNNPTPCSTFTFSFSPRFQTWKHMLCYRASPTPRTMAQRGKAPLRCILHGSCCSSADHGLPPLQFPLYFWDILAENGLLGNRERGKQQ